MENQYDKCENCQTVNDLKHTINGLHHKLASYMKQYEEEIDGLQEEIADLQIEIANLEETADYRRDGIAEQEKRIKRLEWMLGHYYERYCASQEEKLNETMKDLKKNIIRTRNIILAIC